MSFKPRLSFFTRIARDVEFEFVVVGEWSDVDVDGECECNEGGSKGVGVGMVMKPSFDKLGLD